MQISQQDNRLYKYITLANKLKVLLISDPEAEHAAAALNVGVGSAQDPDDRLGMAHFLEHMLFLGTQKYPGPDDYSSFITCHGGNYNAYTSFEHTNYFFDIETSYFADALDRFSQFFIAPLFSEQFVDKEKNAVNSEYKTYVGNDDANIMYVLKEIANSQHPFSKFNIGSLETLSDTEKSNARDDVIQFYNKYYSSNLMCLTLLSNNSLEELEQFSYKYFANIKNHDASIVDTNAPLFNDNLPQHLYIKPKKSKRELELYFPIPSMHEAYATKPFNYLSHIIGHENSGSLIAYLKKHGLANALSSGVEFKHRQDALFNISIELTNKGLNKIQEVLKQIFHYIGLTVREGINSLHLQELMQLSSNEFTFQEKGNPMSYALNLAHNLHYYPPNELLTAPALITEPNLDLIKEAATYLRLNNCLIITTANDVDTDKIEKWFQVPYKITSLSEQEKFLLNQAYMQCDNSSLAMPTANTFIPTKFDLIKQSKDVSAVPEKIYTQGNLSVWHLADNEFSQPRGDICIKFMHSDMHIDANHSALVQLYIKLCRDYLDENTYYAQIAGFDYALYTHPQGFTLKIYGFADKQAEFTASVLKYITTAQFKHDRFDRIKKTFLEKLDNELQESPYQQTMRYTAIALTKNLFSSQDIKAALETISLEQVNSFIKEIYSRCSLLTFIHGNYTTHQAQHLSQHIYDACNNKNLYTPVDFVISELRSSSCKTQLIPSKHIDSSVCLYFQSKTTDYASYALFELLAHIIHVPFFEDIRTNQQLGYKVSAFNYMLNTTAGLTFTVESDVKSAAYVYEKINAFLQNYRDEIIKITSEELEQQKCGLIANITCKPKNLNQKTERLWLQLNQNKLNFDSKKQLAAAIDKISKQDLVNFYKDLVSSKYGSLVSYSFGKHSKNAIVF